MLILRTPDEPFRHLPDFPYEPRYQLVEHQGEHLRMHYIDEGPGDAPVVLMLHGEPSWSFSYRHVIKAVVAAGFRAVAPDHIGFGRSDKLASRSDYRYAGFVDWMSGFVEALDLRDIVLLCQDWGGPIGLSVLARMPERFSAVVASNTLLPNCQEPPLGVPGWPGDIIDNWADSTAQMDDMPVGEIVAAVAVSPLDEAVKAAYDAPFPDASYKSAALEFPSLIPRRADMAGCLENRAVWDLLEGWHKPFVTAFSDSDPTTRDWAEVFRNRIPGAANDWHCTIAQAGHFVQEEQGPALADLIVRLRSAVYPH